MLIALEDEMFLGLVGHENALAAARCFTTMTSLVYLSFSASLSFVYLTLHRLGSLMVRVLEDGDLGSQSFNVWQMVADCRCSRCAADTGQRGVFWFELADDVNTEHQIRSNHWHWSVFMPWAHVGIFDRCITHLKNFRQAATSSLRKSGI